MSCGAEKAYGWIIGVWGKSCRALVGEGGVSAGSVLELLVISGKGGGETYWGASWFEVPGMGQRMERYKEKQEGGGGEEKSNNPATNDDDQLLEEKGSISSQVLVQIFRVSVHVRCECVG